MKNLKIIAICFVIIFLLHKIWKLDLYDRTHPYGLDDAKNKKYAPNIVGEKYGVHVFKGRPTKKDDILSRLNKIEWLADSYKRNVTWRRSLCFGIIGTLILLALKNYEDLSNLNIVLSSVIIISGMVYFYQSYNNYHLEYYKNRYVHQHIDAIKKSLGK
jgi:hypothetical protein